MTTQPDDLDALRAIVKALEPFDDTVRDRIIRWARERLGMVATAAGTPSRVVAGATPESPRVGGSATGQDIQSFVREKAPKSDQQFATVVAYYYRFVAPESERKEAITASDLVDSTRLAARPRLKNAAKTLNNAHGAGYLDKADRGAYKVSSVGENLVAIVLPGGSSNEAKPRARRTKKTKGKRVARK